ncbi:ABC transporter permease [Leucobacter weissii]|nr:ABC transporter permease [Leucobacter weissii]
MRFRLLRIGAGLILPLAVLLVWWLGTEQGWLNTRVYSSPRLIWAAAATLWEQGLLQQHLLVSLQRAGAGFVIGSVLGIALGVLSGFFRPVELLIDPSVQLFRAIPLTIVLPLFIVWFGFGELPRLLLIILVIVPNLYIDTYSGLRNVDKKLLEVGRVFGLPRAQVIFGVIIPAALPFIFNGLRKASIYAFIMLVFAETLNASSGLGYLAAQAMQFVRMDVLFLVVFIYAILGISADGLVRGIEKLATPWRGKKAVR